MDFSTPFSSSPIVLGSASACLEYEYPVFLLFMEYVPSSFLSTCPPVSCSRFYCLASFLVSNNPSGSTMFTGLFKLNL